MASNGLISSLMGAALTMPQSLNVSMFQCHGCSRVLTKSWHYSFRYNNGLIFTILNVFCGSLCIDKLPYGSCCEHCQEEWRCSTVSYLHVIQVPQCLVWSWNCRDLVGLPDFWCLFDITSWLWSTYLGLLLRLFLALFPSHIIFAADTKTVWGSLPKFTFYSSSFIDELLYGSCDVSDHLFKC